MFCLCTSNIVYTDYLVRYYICRVIWLFVHIFVEPASIFRSHCVSWTYLNDVWPMPRPTPHPPTPMPHPRNKALVRGPVASYFLVDRQCYFSLFLQVFLTFSDFNIKSDSTVQHHSCQDTWRRWKRCLASSSNRSNPWFAETSQRIRRDATLD